MRHDLVMTTRGTIGNVAYYDDNVPYENVRINSGMVIFRVDPSGLHPKFLYHFLRSPDFIGQTISMRTGVAQPQFPIRDIRRVELPTPDLPIQGRIVSVLSTYDDLIENNRRRMALLEDAARQLYREWFVRLRFPGHEHTHITNGVPEGWVRAKVGPLLFKVSRGEKVKKDDYEPNGAIPCVDQGSEFIGGYTNDQEALIDQPLPIIVFGDHTRILKFVNFPFACGADGTQLIYPNTPKISPEYFYFTLKAIDLANYFYARHFKFLKDHEVYIPPQPLVREFTRIAATCLEQIKVLRSENDKLRAARDLLLPRLMSGEIVV